MMWARKAPKACEGILPLRIRTNSHGIMETSKAREFYDSDIKPFRRGRWIVSHEPRFILGFSRGVLNRGLDIPSRKQTKERNKRFTQIKILDENDDSIFFKMRRQDEDVNIQARKKGDQ